MTVVAKLPTGVSGMETRLGGHYAGRGWPKALMAAEHKLATFMYMMLTKVEENTGRFQKSDQERYLERDLFKLPCAPRSWASGSS